MESTPLRTENKPQIRSRMERCVPESSELMHIQARESESEKQKDINEGLWKKREETMQVVYCARSTLSVV